MHDNSCFELLFSLLEPKCRSRFPQQEIESLEKGQLVSGGNVVMGFDHFDFLGDT